jgi:hypothetical protein
MSRSGYTDDCDDQWGLIRWRGAVKSSIRGERGQAALKELAAAMDAMPNKTLAAESLVSADGEFCTLGVLGQARGLDMNPLDPDDWDAVAKAFNIAPAMVREIVYENDESFDTYEWVPFVLCGPIRPWQRHADTRRVDLTEEVVGKRRWHRMRAWVESNIVKATAA